MPLRPSLLIFLLLATPIAGPAAAQAHTPFQLHPSPLWAARGADRRFTATGQETASSPQPMLGFSKPTRWKAGAITGAIVVGLLFGAGADGLCHLSEERNHSCTSAVFGSTLVGALVGGTIGSLIGGQFPKHERPPADSTRTMP